MRSLQHRDMKRYVKRPTFSALSLAETLELDIQAASTQFIGILEILLNEISDTYI